MCALKVVQHPDKTFIRRVARGFDFLGYQFGVGGLGIARQSIERSLGKMARLYEQGADEVRVGVYWRNWVRWVTGGWGGG